MPVGTRLDLNRLKIQIKQCLKTLPDEEMCVRMHMGNHLVYTGVSYLKSTKKSEETRNEGNKLFLQSSHDSQTHHKIVHLYNESIAYAPNESEELASAYGNKSAILRHIRKYAESIVEADKALKITTSASLKVKLLCRKAECHTALGSCEGTKCLEKARFVLNKDSLPEQLENSLQDLINKTQTVVNARRLDRTPVDPKEILASKLIADAEKIDVWSSVRIGYSPEYGRHLVAVRDFKPGEIITVEKPFLNTLVEWLIFVNCYHCFEYLWTAVPCDHCAYRLYCSEKCKKESWNLFHEMDCSILRPMKEGALLEDDFDHVRPLISFFSRAFKEAGSIEQLLIDVEALENYEDKPIGLPSDGNISSYKTLYLVPTRDLPADEYETCMKRAAVALLGLAKYTKILGTHYEFKDIKKLRRNDTAIFLGAFLFKISWVMKSRVTRTLLTDPSEPPPTIDIKAGKIPPLCLSLKSLNFLFPLVCVPNCRGILGSQNKNLMYALQPIKKGTMLTSSSKSVYQRVKKNERVQNLQELYHRVATCRACKENWFERKPTEAEFKREIEPEPIIGLGLMREIELLLQENDPEKLFKKTRDILERAWQHFSMPSTVILEATSIMMNVLDTIFYPLSEDVPPCRK